MDSSYSVSSGLAKNKPVSDSVCVDFDDLYCWYSLILNKLINILQLVVETEPITPDTLSLPGPSGRAPRVKRKARKSFVFEVSQNSVEEGGRDRNKGLNSSINASVYDEIDESTENMDCSAFLRFPEDDYDSLDKLQKFDEVEK